MRLKHSEEERKKKRKNSKNKEKEIQIGKVGIVLFMMQTVNDLRKPTKLIIIIIITKIQPIV